MVLTGAQQFELRAKKALETGENSFKPRGAANKAAFAEFKKEFDEQTAKITSYTTKETDRVIKEISPLTALFGGGMSSNPQERINARQFQNAANNKANKADREKIRQEKATAKEAKAEAKAKAKANAKPKAKPKAKAPESSGDSSDEAIQCRKTCRLRLPQLKPATLNQAAVPMKVGSRIL